MCTTAEQQVSLWMIDGKPVRMVFAGRRWRVSDMPTPIRESVWAVPLDRPRCRHAWRFQATDPTGYSVVFDVYGGDDGWHVHRAWE